jgi:hypothetical protein
MMHIVVWNGFVTHVYKLNENPNKPDTLLQEEFDYKVEYYPQEEEQTSQLESQKPDNAWLTPKVYQGKKEK